jgi:hypothetical protein
VFSFGTLSLVSQSHHRIDLARATGGNPAGDDGNRQEERSHEQNDQGVGRWEYRQNRGKEARDPECAEQADRRPHDSQPLSLADHEPEHIAQLRAEGHSHANLARAPHHKSGNDTVDSKTGQGKA